jgi:DNA (cytosine-5)-methyltransferase 1
LGEGFSALRRGGEPVFKIKLSIEKDFHAHQTLELRAFYRQFPDRKAPAEYYKYLAGRLSREALFEKFPEEARKASDEAWHIELGGKHFSETQIDARICGAIGKRVNWVLIGGPPCQAYSIVGHSRVIGGEGLAAYEADPKHHLYEHYLRILSIHQPPVFIMENVKGLLSARYKSEGIFQRILKDLKHPLGAMRWAGNPMHQEALEYQLMPLAAGSGELLANLSHTEPRHFVLRAEDYGIPQARHRIIVLGIRADLRLVPIPLQKSQAVSVAEVIADLPKLRSGLSREADSPEGWRDAVLEITDSTWLRNDTLPGGLREALLRASARVRQGLGRGGRFLEGMSIPAKCPGWFLDKRLQGVCNHETRVHIREDLHRYFFAAVFAKEFKRSPLLEDLPKALLPEHANVEAALKETKFNDRFRVQMAGRPSTTIVSHIARDGHYYIHYDPAQCRSLTVREAARLQTFPDNYFFEGPRTQQYQQVGNAVPPLLAKKIADIVADLLQPSCPNPDTRV